MSNVCREDVRPAYLVVREEHDLAAASDFYEAIYKVIEAAKAPNLKGREKVAITKDGLVSRVLPNLQHEAELDPKDPEYELNKWVFREARKEIWATTRPFYGRMQAMLAERNGHVLLRYGGIQGNQVYITRDPECIRVDLVDSRGAADVRQIEKVASLYGAMSKRLPQTATMFAEAFDGWLVEMLAVGRSHVPLLLEKYSPVGDETDFEDGDAEDTGGE